MKTPWERLRQAFVQDHREMTRGYKTLLRLLDQRDFVRLSEEANRLDKTVGPHIEFEERFLYPSLGESRGEGYVSQLLHEHSQVLSVLTELQHLTADAEPSVKQIDTWISQLMVGLEHASTCGTLLSELQELKEHRQLELLDGLTRLRDKGTPWSELRLH